MAMRRGLGGGIVLSCLVAVLPARAQDVAARLAATSFPASAPAETLLRVAVPGRFAISAHSATGVALDLIDMITGPTQAAGTPGSADGRLDLLLDVGVYKIRLHPAAGAQGAVQLRVSPFADIAPPAILPHDAEADAELGDLQQRAFWFTVSGIAPVRIEAAGRALADLRLWRDGRDLQAIPSTTRIIEPAKGHKLRDILITGTLPPGTYRATAYGGPALPWADGSAALPFHVREGASGALLAGWTGAKIGPFGSEIYREAGTDDLVRLSMEGPATLAVDGAEAAIDRKNRVPMAELRVATRAAGHDVTVSAPEFTPFQLRTMAIGTVTSITLPGSYVVTGNTTGLGGDDVPATLVLARASPTGWTIAGSNAPEIGPQSFWHHRFSLGGEVSLLFHVIQAGKIAATVRGVRLGALDLTALDALATHPPLSPDAPGVWDVPAGWYALTLAPAGNTQGIADLTLAPPGISVALAPPSPPSPSISFGVQSLGANEVLRVFGNASPDSAFGLDARTVPVSLNAAPLRVGQETGVALAIPVDPGAGALTALEYGVGRVPVSYDALTGTAQLPAAGHPRLVSLFWDHPAPPPAMPQPAPETARETLHDGTTRYFDLAENAARSFTLDVGSGGLFRVETLGRLHTRGAIGSHFVPELQTAEANGIGQNMLLQGFLRAGRYHVDVTARQSGGHAGIAARPAPLQTVPALLPGGTVRATMPAGAALLVPVSIAKAGTYRIELLGLGKTFSARLEDAEGWPFAATAPFDTVTQDLAAGQYRLLVSPEAVESRAVARLTRIETPRPLAGHGPHALPFDAPQAFTWREPAGRNDPRQPDDWQFDLAAPADMTLSVTDGMEAFLRDAATGHEVAHLVGGTPFTGHLAAGAYRVEARSQGRNDRLDYIVSLTAVQMQPGVARRVTLPGSVAFAVASDRVVSLTSFGGVPVRAVLKDAAGRVLERAGARSNDWNVTLSRLLPAGAYTLDLASAAPPPLHAVPANINDGAAPAAAPSGDGDQDNAGPDGNGQAGDGQAGDGQADNGQADNGQADNGQAGMAEPAQTDTAAAGQDGQQDADATAQGGTELTLSLPDEHAPVRLSGTASLPGGGVQHLMLAPVAAGQLILAGAASPADIVLSLEQQSGGAWRSRAVAQGLAPVLALPADDGAGAWRLSVWPVDGGRLPVQVAARIEASEAAPGQPAWRQAALPGISDRLAVAHVALGSQTVVRLSGSGAAHVLAGAWRGHQAMPPEAGPVAPQQADLWLVAPDAGAVTLTPLAPGAGLTINLPEGAHAALPRQPGALTAWIGEGSGQPGLGAGHGMGVAGGSALALAQGEAAIVWNAGGGDVLRVSARPVALTQAPSVNFDTRPSWTLPAASAIAVGLPAGLHTLRLDLLPGTAAIAGWPDPHAVTVWSGHDAVSRTLEGQWRTVLLVNTNTRAAPAGLSADSLASTASLRPDRAEKRFFGAAGSIDLPVSAVPGQSLVIAGGTAAMFVGDDGRVLRGTRLALTGPGRVIVQHGAGLVAAWLEGKDAAPWPAPTQVAMALPASLALSGPAMQLALSPASAGLLRIRSTAPVILSLNGGQPELFPAGAAASRYLPAGAATLRIIAPQDGGLSGSMDLTTAPVHPAQEGLGETVAVAPGDTALFGVNVPRPARIGLAVRAQPDDASLMLLDSAGHPVASGAAMLRDLPAGRYILSASVPRDAATTTIQPAILGLAPRPNGPPPDVIEVYRKLAGLTAPKGSAP
jgi:hypothetical protein